MQDRRGSIFPFSRTRLEALKEAANPQLSASCEDASRIHEIAIRKIAGNQVIAGFLH